MMETLVNNSIEITNILIKCIGVGIMPSIVIRLSIKFIKIFVSFIQGGKNVKI